MAKIPIPSVNTPTYQSWATAVATKLNAFAFIHYAATLDVEGRMQIPASAFGLTNIAGGIAGAGVGGSSNIHYWITECYAYAGGATLLIRLCAADVNSNDVSNPASLANAAVSVVAWGTPL